MTVSSRKRINHFTNPIDFFFFIVAYFWHSHILLKSINHMMEKYRITMNLGLLLALNFILLNVIFKRH